MLQKGLLGLLASLMAVLVFNIQIASASGVIKIGVQAPITGKYASEGQSIDKAVRLIVKQYNEKGGILGKKIKVITCDDEAKAQEAAICAKRLVNDGVIAVIGSYTSTASEAAEATYYRAGIIQVSPGTSVTLVQHGYDTFFRSSTPDSAQASFTAEFLIKKQHYKRIAIITDYSTFATNLAKETKKDIKKMGGNVVFYGKITSGAQNFTPILTEIKSYHPDVIYFSGMYTDGGLIMSQIAQLGIKADFVGGDGNDNAEFMKLAGKSAIGSYLIDVPHPNLLPYPAAKKFLKAFRETYHEDPASIWTLYCVDGARAVLYSIKETKSLNTKKIAEYMHSLKNFPGITGPIEWAKNGERLGSSYMAYRVGPDMKYHVVYMH